MKKARELKSCIPGLYIQIGDRGARAGETNCLKRRRREAERKYRACLGRNIETFLVDIEPNQAKRREAEPALILDVSRAARRMGLRACNRVLR